MIESGGSPVTAVAPPSGAARCAAGEPPSRRIGRPVGTRETVAPAFTRLRIARGLSHSRIAYLARRKKFRISKSTVAAIEIGEVLPKTHHLRALAVALGISFEHARELFPTLARSRSL